MHPGEQSFPVFEAFGVLEDCAVALCTEPPLPAYVVLDAFDEPVALFDSLDDAFAFVTECAEWGFIGDVLTFSRTLTPEQKRMARETCS